MTLSLPVRRRLRAAHAVAKTALLVCAVAVGALAAGACASTGGRNKVPAGERQPDKFLFEKGTEALNKKKWITAREYFQTIVESYPQSQYRADAKLGVGDSLLGEGSLATQVQALQEFREFLSFFPTSPRADYAQYKLAMAHYYQMAKPERDQTETKECLREFDTFFERYPNSKIAPEARQHQREARDRLSDSEYRVGYFYFRSRWYPGAIDRFTKLLKADPQYTNRDAVYFHLAEAYVKVNRKAEALPQLQKLIDEFEQSEFLVDAQKLITTLKAEADSPVKPASTPNADEAKGADKKAGSNGKNGKPGVKPPAKPDTAGPKVTPPATATTPDAAAPATSPTPTKPPSDGPSGPR